MGDVLGPKSAEIPGPARKDKVVLKNQFRMFARSGILNEARRRGRHT